MNDVATPPTPLRYEILEETLNSYKVKMTSPTLNTEGLGRAAIRRADRDIKKQALAQLVQDYDLQFVYLRDHQVIESEYYPYYESIETNPFGGMVIAYRVPKGGGHVIEMATSLCSNKDLFDKLEGKFMAANNFASGARVKIKLAEATRWGQQLLTMFSH
jgi:hypothetical protein